MLPARGEIWWYETERFGRRPVVVLSRDMAIPHRRRALVALCTTTVRGLPTEVSLLPDVDPVPRECVVNLDAIETAMVGLLVERLGRVGDDRMRDLCRALSVATGCDARAS